MKIALLGYGKMGREIEALCSGEENEIVARIDNEQDWNQQLEDFLTADVAIEFSTPDSVLENIRKCFKHNIPVVVGTTAWYEHIEEIKDDCANAKGSLIWASNFSIGMNLFFRVNKVFARWMDNYPEYDVAMKEIHHTQKLDAPSGTAISLADILISEIGRLESWQLGKSGSKNILGIEAERIDPVPGTHSITYTSEVDEIEFKHTAKSRGGFARGALWAAQWIKDKKGFYNFADVLFSNH